MFNLFKRSPLVSDVKWIGVDMHSHLLPGIDDGSPDLETSISYISQLNELGYSKFICTPHIFKEIHPNSRETILPALQAVKNALVERGIDVEITAAAEYMINTDFDPLMESDDLMVLNGKRVLIEMSYMFESYDIEKYIFNLRMKGYTPILAHPERYVYYHQDYERYHRFIDMGCLMQVNLLSLSGYYGKGIKTIALKLIKENMIDLIGTDFHNIRHLQAINDFVKSGAAYNLIGKYPFKNMQFFGDNL
ncbi:tyrosine-protein phosphatase YwqE [Mucilaginibacter gracilis]|uniref:protein-tyrosine-phosphatase n=1 Tax=Mucilaginibacter gracilis TaxID=423350 RepID=A0A495IZX1_9SPHI|nr:CpsB/CapC family capsule biosynthesis tyrosine phosphatase [Mucilaginibacter gracilis]RKR82266.1 tyrosine-protein phosphatase YwqE [Mucilaginibacter gracilis]